MHRLAIALVALSFAVPACSARSATEPVDGIPFDVSSVASGGLWQDGEACGHYRVVIRKACSPEHCFDSAVLEWIQSDDTKTTLIGSAPISEVADNLAVVHSVRYLLEEHDGFELLLANTYTEDKARLCVWPTAYQNYDARIIVDSDERLTSRCSRRGPRSRTANGSRRGAARAAERQR